MLNCKKTFLNNPFQLHQYKINTSFDKINDHGLILVQVGLVWCKHSKNYSNGSKMNRRVETKTLQQLNQQTNPLQVKGLENNEEDNDD